MADKDSDLARDQNQRAWNAGRYEAWVKADGAPVALAARLVADPQAAARRIAPHLGDVAGMRICNLQGSRGKVAVALALLGADVTVIDFAEENHRYAMELAAQAGVTIHYHVADVIESATLGLPRFDAVAMELGILHYHQDIARFFGVCAALLARGGVMVLSEFHPVQRKLFWDRAATPPNYFNAELVTGDVPNPIGDEESLGTCTLRFWTLGEIVTAAIGAGFEVTRLEEHPDWDDPNIPGTFTLVARLKP